MTFARPGTGRDAGEIQALITDRYLDSLLGGAGIELLPAADRPGGTSAIDAAVRVVSRRLATDLPRFHPSFRFEERLALRLAEAAAAMRLPLAAGAEQEIASIPLRLERPDPDPLAASGEDAALPADRIPPRPLLVRSAMAASALSLAGAAWLAWHRRGGSPMARAARTAHQLRPSRGHGA